jgi:hypothetical protein
MRIGGLAALALMAVTAPAMAQAQSDDVVVHGAAARQEIERILREDSLTSTQPTPRQVADTMAIIARGTAPQDFWTAYQTHVQAWQRYADLVEQASQQQQQQGESTFGPEGEAGEAQQAIESTFVEVERIARRYGARLPAQPIDPRTIA